MTSLATTDNYETVAGPIGSVDRPRVQRLLDMASDAVLGAAHGQQIVAGVSSGVTVFAHDGVLYLPQRPVTAVAEVMVDGDIVDPSEYRFEAGGQRRHARLIRRSGAADSLWDVPEATVTYSHGWATVPGPIVALVVSLAAGAMSAGGGPVPIEWHAEDVGEKYDAATVQHGNLTITGAGQKMLDRWCGVASLPTMTLTRG